MTVKIVEASIIHAGIISVLHGACFEEIWNEKTISEMLNMPGILGFLIGTEDKIPQGFIMIRVAADEAEIISIGVIPAARKKGLASLLLLKSLKSAAISNVAKIFFEVAEDNKAAIAFYETFGSQIIGKRSGYYKRPSKKVDAIVYSLNL